MRQVKPDEAKKRLLDLIEAAIKGKDVFIFRDDQQTVQLVPWNYLNDVHSLAVPRV